MLQEFLKVRLGIIMQNRQSEFVLSLRGKHGFSLGEVVVSSAVMALMMVWLFNFVDVAGSLWQTSHAKVNLANEANVLLDAIERELSVATSLTFPSVGATEGELRYSKLVSDYHTPTAIMVDLDFRILHDSLTHAVSKEVLFTAPKWPAAEIAGWSIDSMNGEKIVVTSQHNFDLGRNVLELDVFRRHNKLVEITAVLGVIDAQGSISRKISVSRNIVLRNL